MIEGWLRVAAGTCLWGLKGLVARPGVQHARSDCNQAQAMLNVS